MATTTTALTPIRVTVDGRIRITEDGGAERIIERRPQVIVPVAQVVTKLPDVRTVWDPFGLAGVSHDTAPGMFTPFLRR